MLRPKHQQMCQSHCQCSVGRVAGKFSCQHVVSFGIHFLENRISGFVDKMRIKSFLPGIMSIFINNLLIYSCLIFFQAKIDVVEMLLLRLHGENAL